MSNASPFATGSVANAIYLYVDNIIVDQILGGTATHTTLRLIPHDMNRELDTLFASRQRTIAPYGTSFTNIKGAMTLDEYKQSFT